MNAYRKMYTPTEVADELGTSPSTVRRLLRRFGDRIPHEKVGREYLLPIEAAGAIREIRHEQRRPSRRRRAGAAAIGTVAGLLLATTAPARAQDAQADDVRLYPALELAATDGDTVDARLDLGFKLTLDVRIRIAGVDTAETNRGDATLRAHGRDAREYALDWIAGCEGPTALIIDHDGGGFGRALGDLECVDGRRLGADLLEERLALPYWGDVDRASLQRDHRANAEWRARNREPRR